MTDSTATRLRDSKAFSGFAVDDLDAAKSFYGDTLGLELSEEPAGLGLHLASGGTVFVYPKPGHEPASFTILNFPVDDIEGAVDDLSSKGIEFIRYEGFEQDERGIAQPGGGPRIAWFNDPAGNILAVLSG
jgi:catechol 2,3-dioxygenase-like lactoylglutathione lyase family enzyme